MPGQIIPRGERAWLVRVYVGRDLQTGKRKYEGHTVHGTKKDAQTYLNGKMRERDLGTYAGITHTLMGSLFDDLLADYKINGKSYDWVSDVVRVHLGPFFGRVKAASIGTDQIRAYIATRQQPHTRDRMARRARRSASTGLHLTAPSTASLRYCGARSTLAGWRRHRRSEPCPSSRCLRRTTSARDFSSMTHSWRSAARCPRKSGRYSRSLTSRAAGRPRFWRFSGLKWTSSERVVRLEPGETKNDEARTIPLAPDLYEMLKQCRRKPVIPTLPESPWVFSRAGKPDSGFQGRHGRAPARRRGLVDASGEPAKLFHDLRRTGVRNLIRAGVPERVAMPISGHKTRAVFDRYNIVSESDLKDAARRLGEYMAQKSAPGVRQPVYILVRGENQSRYLIEDSPPIDLLNLA